MADTMIDRVEARMFSGEPFVIDELWTRFGNGPRDNSRIHRLVQKHRKAGRLRCVRVGRQHVWSMTEPTHAA
jgi:hypothetical protein